MKFDELTKEEEIIVEAFTKLWSERNVSTISINKANSNSLCKINGKWATFFYIRDEIYNYKEFDDLYSACLSYFKCLDGNNEKYCKSMFPELIKKLADNEIIEETGYVNYNDLTNEEQIILNVFIQLLKDTGDYIRNIIYPESEDKIDEFIERLQVYKKGNVWVAYVLERNEKSGYTEFHTLYSMCMAIFNSMEKTHSDYCLSRFPIMVQQALENNKMAR